MSQSNPFSSTHPTLIEKNLIDWFLSYDISNFNRDLGGSGERRAFTLFSQTVQDVPAYADFIRQHGWGESNTVSLKGKWQSIPSMDKQNYVRLHSLSDMVPNKKIGSYGKIVSLSSGSSGQAFFWPRGTYQEIEGALLHEQLLTTQYEIGRYKTLVVVAFSMGSYLAGTYTYNSIRWVASKDYDLTVVTPGIDVQDGLDMITTLAPLYEQIILVGYPPFIKDLLEAGVNQGINWHNWRVKLLMASEFFSEKWRNGVATLAGIKDIVSSTANIFGASEGTMFGWETPEAIFIRQEATKNPNLHRALFGSDLTPTLVEYNPMLRYFEVLDGNLLLTARAGIPLIRYDLKDRGGILTALKRRKILRSFGVEIPSSLRDKLSSCPMVYVLGRADSAASIYGVLVYPEYIKEAIESVATRLTGRFTIVSDSKTLDNPQLSVHIELKKDRKYSAKLTKQIELQLIKTISARSREYSTLINSVGDKAIPHVYLHPKNDLQFFPNRIKQKWIDHKS